MKANKFVAEFVGTGLLVLFGCGVAVVSGVNLVATALAFGLVLLCLVYIIGPISGCHVNPAVSLAMAINKRIKWQEFVGYVVAQCLGAIVGAAVLYLIFALANFHLGGVAGNVTGLLGQNGFSGDVTAWVALITEVILTFVFVLTVVTATGKKGAGAMAGVIIGLSLVLVHLLGIGITGTSVNPARSLGPALIIGGDALKQLWVFLVAPLVGAALAAVFAKEILKSESSK